jgi:hypothetical protein
MTIYKKASLQNLLKKAAALSAAVLFFANFSFINKENLKFIISGFDFAKASAKPQNIFNLSAHINKAANAVSGLFKSAKAPAISRSGGSRETATAGQNSFLISPVAVFTVSGSAVMSSRIFRVLPYLKGFDILKMYIDPGGRELPAGFILPTSYFLIMLLFFASSRKVFNSILLVKPQTTGL